MDVAKFQLREDHTHEERTGYPRCVALHPRSRLRYEHECSEAALSAAQKTWVSDMCSLAHGVVGDNVLSIEFLSLLVF